MSPVTSARVTSGGSDGGGGGRYDTCPPAPTRPGRVLSVTACMAGACCSPRDYYMIYDTFTKPAQKVARPNLITISMTVGLMCSQAKQKQNKPRSHRYVQFMTL